MDKARWQNLSFAQQMGNVGSEIARARVWDEKGDWESRGEALVRALELLDLTISDLRWRSKLNELTRIREVVASWFAKISSYDVSFAFLEKMCTDLAIAAARH